MSWTSRLGNLGRFSPFAREPPRGSTKVSEADYSYITAEDLRKHQSESLDEEEEDDSDLGPPRDTDVLVLRNKRQEYHVHFPAYSIGKGELTIGQVKEHAARKFNTSDARRVKLLYRGKNLKDDSRTCKQEGLRDGAELMVTVADSTSPGSPSDSEDDAGSNDGLDDQQGGGESKRRRNRGKKTKRRNKREERQATSDTASPRPDGRGPGLEVPPSAHASRSQSPNPAASPATPLDKLNALHQKLQEYVPACRAFLASPPSDPAKKEFEHKRLSETIMTQVLLKLDAIETEGDADARSRRKELVRETQQQLTELDAVMKS